MNAHAYPVHVDATLDAHLSRWLWLVKWVLAIPHYFVLAFLWLAFFVLSVVAFFAILFTGHYPRAIFDFNVGVLRWSWRVAYYTYGALGTDRYPPFTLAQVPDYPAHFTVDYPEHLSRGLVLVKWWLLAIPHYLIVAILAGSGLYIAWDATSGEPTQWSWGGGLIGLLAFIAAVVLLFTGRYPQQIFDLVLGLNRWVLRVAAYAALMTDEYPPFRLDMGGPDPDSGVAARVSLPENPPGAPSAVPPAQPMSESTAQSATQSMAPTAPAPSAGPATASTAAPTAAPTAATATAAGTGETRFGAGRVVAIVLGALVFLVGGGFIAGGTALAVADQTLRNNQGFLMSPTQTFSTSTYAVATEPMNIDGGGSSDFVPQTLLGEVAVRANGLAGADLFVGVAPSADVDRYLAGVEHVTLVDLQDVDGRVTPTYRESQGAAPSVQPEDADIWAATASGAGEQQLIWEPRSGDWTVVVMNTDAGAGVAADMSVGATAPVLGWVTVGLFVTGGLLLVIAIVVVLAALHGSRAER